MLYLSTLEMCIVLAQVIKFMFAQMPCLLLQEKHLTAWFWLNLLRAYSLQGLAALDTLEREG